MDRNQYLWWLRVIKRLIVKLLITVAYDGNRLISNITRGLRWFKGSHLMFLVVWVGIEVNGLGLKSIHII